MKRKILIAFFIVGAIGMPRNVSANVGTNHIEEFTIDEAQMLMKIAQAEAGNQGIDGMSAVMRVVINRAESPDFPSSIKDVIEQPHQFQSYENGTYNRAEPSRECHLALADVERGISADDVIVAFEISTNGKSLEKYFDFAYCKKNHNFYVKKGAEK